MAKVTKCPATVPFVARNMFRQGQYYQGATFGVCPGHLQANMAIMDAEFADDFEEFCRQNHSACPLIYRSKPGEVAAPLIAAESDIRTDLPAYNVFKNGEFSATVENLLSYPWNNFVSFYLGCSFSFDDKLLEKGIKLKNLDKNVSMFTTSIKCKPVGVFSSNVVVSMRSIEKSKLHLAYEATVDLDYAHGAPIHLGRPEDIGIADIKKSEFGSDFGSTLVDNEIPVFWACGVTSTVAVKGAELKTNFSHRPGGMFIADIICDDAGKIVPNKLYPKPMVICLDDELKRFSAISETAWKLLDKIEEEVFEDLGNRGIKELLVKDDFHKACLSLSKNAKSVGIIVGFPLFRNCPPAEENDGIAGAIYIARTLSQLGVSVTFFVDDHSEILKKTLEDSVTLGYVKSPIQVRSVGKDFSMQNVDELLDPVTKLPKYTHLIGIERPSQSQDGTYRTMNASDISDMCNPVDYLFLQAASHPDIVTIGIGDGGNELGMGKVHDHVVRTVRHGDKIASKITCDYLITCGVSNWSGLALSAGISIARLCPVHDRFQRNGLGFTQEVNLDDMIITESEDEALHKYLTELGFRDASGQNIMAVDTLDYYDVHVKKLQKCREIAMEGKHMAQ